MHKAILEKICYRIDTYQNESINLQRELTAIPALAPENGGDGEQKSLNSFSLIYKKNYIVMN
ncbi:MAG: hypothetical protein ACE5HI_14910 [bacterium]